MLEEATEEVPHELEAERKRAVARLGQSFAVGDDAAILELQQIAMLVQTDVLERLQSAIDGAGEGSVRTVAALVDAVELARDRTMLALLGLKMRLREMGSGSDGARTGSTTSTTSQLQLGDAPANGNLSDGVNATGGAENGQTTDGLRRPHGTSLISMLRSNTLRSSNAGGDSRQNLLRRSTNNPFSLLSKDRKASNDEGDENASEARARASSQSRVSDETVPFPAFSTSIASSGTSPQLTRSASVLQRGAVVANPRNSGTTVTVPPNPANNYLGFCKGAARLQSGDRLAMHKAKEFPEGRSHRTSYFLTCSNSKCAFATHMDLNTIWDRVWTLNDLGLKIRWAFLAKSHVLQTKVKDQKYRYSCLFCVFAGVDAPVIEGTDAYLRHISQQHRGRAFGDVTLYRTGCINDRIAEDSEEFDVNFFPLTVSEYTERSKRGEDLSDENVIVGRVGDDANAPEATPCDEPWCQDLPDFQYADSFERGMRDYSLTPFQSYS